MVKWEKAEFGNDYIVFRRENGNNIRIKKVYQIGEHLNHWYVFGYGVKIKRQYFKTKSEAIAYAMKYMRSH